jgi:23S rRNA (guanine745-N1)-methyltransferase
MRAEVVRHLRCPVCALPMAIAPDGGTLRCPRGHSFDVARQGYVNLTAGRAPRGGDTAEMVAAREEFLRSGAYDFITQALVAAARATTPAGAFVVDAGAGTGHHLAAVVDALPEAVGLALDVAKPALRRAARAHPRCGAALVDTWARWPLADGAASLLLNVFAPRNGGEFRRVLRDDGTLLVVTPAEDHLRELIGPLGMLRVDPEKPARVTRSLAGHFTAVRVDEHRHTLRLSHAQVRALVAMGPSAWHTTPDRLTQAIAALPDPVTVTAAVTLGVYRPAPGRP